MLLRVPRAEAVAVTNCPSGGTHDDRAATHDEELTHEIPDSLPEQVAEARPLAGVTIAHFGHFRPKYSRNLIVAKALARAGADVQVVTDLRPFVKRSPLLARELFRRAPDLVWVGFPGHGDMGAARLPGLRRRTPVIFDAFISLYETEEDKLGYRDPTSLRARCLALEDRLACKLATRVVLDTDTHARYFAERFGVPARRLRRLWVGADEDSMRPGPTPDDTRFRVFVYASFAPLHGLEHVVRAASLLERRGVDVQFDVVGRGKTTPVVQRLAGELGVHNVQFLGRLPYDQLPGLMANSHVHLGIFGTSGKSQRVIPNKVFDALAVARPVVTADTPAVREVLVDGEHALLCPPGDPDALADALVTLAADAELRAGLAERGHDLFHRKFGLDALSRDVTRLVREVLT